jgi:diguanylate cyclase (GGDEF)-like protein/PAS domain S-box-containing protein
MLSASLFQTILDSSEMGLVLLDENGRVLLWNAWMAEASGLSADAATRRSLSELFGQAIGPRLQQAIDHGLERGMASTLSGGGALPLTKEVEEGGKREEIKQMVVVKPLALDGQRRCLLQITDTTIAESRESALRRQARSLQALADTHRISEAHIRAIVDHTTDAIITFDASGAVGTYNPAAETIFGYAPTDIAGKPVGLLVPELMAVATRGANAFARFAGNRREALGRRQNGSTFPIELSVSKMEIAGSLQHIAVAHDITERKVAEDEIRLQKEWLTTLIDALPDIVCIKDGSGCWQVANQFYLNLFRLTGVDYQGCEARALARQTPHYEKLLLATLDSDEEAWTEQRPIAYEQVVPLLDGTVKTFEMHKTPLFNPDGSRKGLVVLGRDVTDRRSAAARIQQLSHLDTLTDLPNRSLFQDRLRHALAQARRSGGMVGLLLIDLDKFKDVNDTLGHRIGDMLLRAVAKRLQRCVRETDTVARVGGDEFALVLTNLPSADGASTVADTALQLVAEPYALDDYEIITSASIGITIFPEDGLDAELLLKNVDLALYRAKVEGGARHHFYVTEMEEEVQRRKAIENDLRHALGTDQMTLFYQPQIDLKTGQITGAEALIRWYHPERGPISPAMFIPIAERTELIFPLGRWVLERACAQIQAWKEAGLPPLRVAVNLSPAQFRHHDLLGTIKSVIEKSGVDPRQLQLEITETIAMTNFEYSVGILKELRELGLTIAMDDFGTGYSSLNYLKRFPVDKLKIDRSFVTDIGLHPDNAAIVRAIIALGHGIGAKVNVEGVETAEQLAFMRTHGCDDCQGFYFSRPLPAEDYAKLVAHPVPWVLEAL